MKIAIALTLLVASNAFAQMPGMGQMFSPEAMEYMNHKIDMDSVEKAFKANTALSKLAAEQPELKEQVKLKMGQGSGQHPAGQPPKMPSMDEMVSAIRAYPAAVSAIESSGLSVENYFKTNYSLMYGWMMHQMQKRGVLDQMLQMMPNMKKSVNLDLVAANEQKIQQYIDDMRSLGQ